MPYRPFLSIIVPTYNSGATIQNTLNSIIGQNFDDYEVIIIDGASTDETNSIISQVIPANKLIHLSEADSGIYDAMNKGIKHANGEWLYFMGSDDIFVNYDGLSKIYTDLNNNDRVLVYGNVIGQNTKTRHSYNTTEEILTDGIHHQSVFYRKILFDENGFYDTAFKIAADYHFTLKVFVNPNYLTSYVDVDICAFGENGLSSKEYDYKFYSSHFKLISTYKCVKKTEAYRKCLENSIYCCLYLAMNKKNRFFAWTNFLYYMFQPEFLSFGERIKKTLQMLRWTIDL